MLILLGSHDWADLLRRPDANLWRRLSAFVNESGGSLGLSYSLLVELAAARKSPEEIARDVGRCTSLPHKWIAADLAERELHGELVEASGGYAPLRIYVDSFFDAVAPHSSRRQLHADVREAVRHPTVSELLESGFYNPHGDRIRLGRETKQWAADTMRAIEEQFRGDWIRARRGIYLGDITPQASRLGLPDADAWAEAIWADPRSCPSRRLDHELMLCSLYERRERLNSGDRLNARTLSCLPYCDAVTAHARLSACVSRFEREWIGRGINLGYTSKLFPCLDQLLAKYGY